MKLVTFQSYEALKYLINNKCLITDSKHINLKKVGYTYDWVNEKMNERISNEDNIKYPIWAWVKCYNAVAPKKIKGEPVKGYDVKITFNKNIDDVFITDF